MYIIPNIFINKTMKISKQLPKKRRGREKQKFVLITITDTEGPTYMKKGALYFLT